MKSYSIYRNIRSSARIFGLSVGSFAIQMTSVIASLLIIIFSFSLLSILLLPAWNMGLYIFLLRSPVFCIPFRSKTLLTLISNKLIGLSKYED